MSCSDLEGAKVYSEEGIHVYLGFFGSKYASESIMNTFGTYGSQYNLKSVRNNFGNYGSQFGFYSANNDYANKPPIIYKDDVFIGYLTTNKFKFNGVSLSVIDENCTFYSTSPSNDTVTLTTYYRDFDNDGYGDPNSPFESAYQPNGYVTNNLDCNDYDSSIHPGAVEIPGDGIDQDCDGFDLPVLQQSLNGINSQIITFKFFECPNEGVPFEQRNYSNLFEQTTTRFIDFELKLEHYPPGRVVEIPLTIKYFYPDGTQMAEFIENIKIEAGWTWSIHWGNGWGWVEPGQWKTGTYTVKIFEDTREIVSGRFSITTTINKDYDDNYLPKEHTLTKTQISQLYVSIFGRASEGEGNAYWRSTESDMMIAAGTMLDTTAARDYFGATFYDNQAFIEFIYENTLGKTIFDDPEGITYWVSELESGKPKAEVITTLIDSAQHPANAGEAQDRFNNRVSVCNYVADTIYSCPDINDLSMFVYFISGVDGNPLSVARAKESIDMAR